MLRAATYIVFFLFALSGTLSVGAAVCRWRWFFETQNSRVMMRFFGRRGVRCFIFFSACLFGRWLMCCIGTTTCFEPRCPGCAVVVAVSKKSEGAFHLKCSLAFL